MVGIVVLAVATVAAVWGTPIWVVVLQRRVRDLERAARDSQDAMERLTKLTARMEALEQAYRAAPAAASPGSTAPVVPDARAAASSAPPDVAAPAPSPRAAATPGLAQTIAAPSAAGEAAPRFRMPDRVARGIQPRDTAPVSVAPVPDARGPEAALDAREAVPSEAWELVVGGSWLNKLGALVLVIGIALLVGYSMSHIGPGGRVALGYLLSGALLASGIALERRRRDRAYAYGLIAGGWAGVYFTTYAMHGVAAARILDNHFAATSALALVAAGMIAHSLRYRSQTVTALAYVVAYATLTITPLSGFALVASAPLAACVIVVAARLGWPGISALGVAATYGMFSLRGILFPGAIDPRSATPYLALFAYWATFEGADLVGRWRDRDAASATAPVFALNAVGFLGATLLQLPMDDPHTVSLFLLAAAAAYLASAIARARLARRRDGGAAHDVEAGSQHVAVALSAALVAWAAGIRLTGAARVSAFLLDAELLVVAGLTLRERLLRLIGSWGAAGVTLAALDLLSPQSRYLLGLHAGTPIAVITAAVWLANREAIRRFEPAPWPVERAYVPAAALLFMGVLTEELGGPYRGLGVLLLAAALVSAGLRRGLEYRAPAYVTAAVSVLLTLAEFAVLRTRDAIAAAGVPGGPSSLLGPTPGECWIGLGMSATVVYLGAAALARGTQSAMAVVERRLAAALAACLGTAYVALLEWQLIDTLGIGPAWALTGGTLLAIGIWRREEILRWQGYALMLVGAARAIGPIITPGPAPDEAVWWMASVIAVLYVSAVAATHRIRDAGSLEEVLRVVLSLAATASLSTLLAEEVRSNLVTLALGLQGASLLAAGFPARDRILRLSGLAVLLFCIVKLFVYDLSELESLARIFSFVVLGLVLLAVSWTYTHYREVIRKYL